jgi:hypothetical protein
MRLTCEILLPAWVEPTSPSGISASAKSLLSKNCGRTPQNPLEFTLLRRQLHWNLGVAAGDGDN